MKLSIRSYLVLIGFFALPILLLAKGKAPYEEIDQDGDGYTISTGDCNEDDNKQFLTHGSPAIDSVAYNTHPGAADAPSNIPVPNGQAPDNFPNVDNNCDCVRDYSIDADHDGDGFSIVQGDCLDNQQDLFLKSLSDGAPAPYTGHGGNYFASLGLTVLNALIAQHSGILCNYDQMELSGNISVNYDSCDNQTYQRLYNIGFDAVRDSGAKQVSDISDEGADALDWANEVFNEIRK